MNTTKSNLSFVFPGQGSQKIGMLREFTSEETIRVTFSEASEVLGYDVWALIQEGDPSSINLTTRTQPILLCCSLALRLAEVGPGAPNFVRSYIPLSACARGRQAVHACN